MFTAYFDDSGTDNTSDIAVAACYISAKRGWDEFVEAWDHVSWEEGFDCFHMAEFIAPREQGHKPWCDWDNAKKERVYNRLARIINENKRIGIAVAVPKQHWDNTPERIRQFYGREHYTFAVRKCLLRIKEWREKSMITLPIQYVFDWEMSTAQKRKEISGIFDLIQEKVADHFGVVPGGFGFQHKEDFKPLQAADVLAWQMRSHMRSIWPLGQDSNDCLHPGFRILREDQEMQLGFFTENQIKRFVESVEELEKRIGQPLPVLYP